MVKRAIIFFALLSAPFFGFGGEAGIDKNAGVQLELKLTSHCASYVIDRGGKSAEEYAAYLKAGNTPYGPAVALMVELRNTGEKEVIAFGAPRPQFILKGPRAESVCEVAPTHFQQAPSRRYVIAPGKSAFLNVISFFNPAKDEPSVKDTIKRLSYSDGTALNCVNWTEPGEYTLSCVLPVGISSAPAGAKPFPKQQFSFPKLPDDLGLVTLQSPAIKLTIRDGNLDAYWSDALEDADAEVRFVAAHTLTASLPLTEAVRVKMAGRLQDSDVRVRKSGTRALQRPSGFKAANVESLDRDPAVVALIGALKDPNAGVRGFAVAALATWGRTVTPSAPAMLPLLQDSDASVRLACAEALGDLFADGAPNEKEVARALIAAIKDGDERVANAAIVSLSRLKAPDTIGALIPLCNGGSAAIKRAAIEGIGDIGGDAHAAEEALFTALASNDTRASAAAALGQIKADPKKLLPALTVALKAESDGFGRVAIVRAMGTCGAAAEPELLSAFKNDTDPTVREYAQKALNTIGGK